MDTFLNYLELPKPSTEQENILDVSLTIREPKKSP